MLVVSNVGRVADPARRPAVGVSPTGILAYQTGGGMNTGQLVWRDRSGKTVDSLPADASGRSPELSPDGLSVAVRRTNAAQGESIWITDLVKKSPQRLTWGPEALHDTSPVWSPLDGRMAFGRLVDGVYIVDTKDNSKSEPVLKTHDSVDSWSRDGKYLLLDGAGHMSLLPLSGDQKPIPVGSLHGRTFGGRISPDGKFIAFVSDESGQNEIYVQPMPPDTGQPKKVSFGKGVSPRWRGDSKELFFVSPDRGSIMTVDIRAGRPVSTPQSLFEIKDTSGPIDYDVRRDGQQFLIYKAPPEAQDTPITVVLNWWAALKQQR
jgi:Tol biopolymer transport system component